MADLQPLRDKIAKKRGGIGSQQVARLIRKKEKDTLFPQRLATLAVAHDNGIGITHYATPEELGQLRESNRIGVGPSATLNLEPAPPPKANGTSRRPRTASRARTAATPARSGKAKTRERRVIVCYGRDEEVRKDVFRYLRGLDLLPIPWPKAILETKRGSPSISEILDALYADAAAVVVVMTPDDRVTLAEHLQKPGDAPFEGVAVGQARPNVFIEAGLAIARFGYERTILVQVGKVKVPTDLDKHVTRLTNSRESRHELMIKLKAAGCDVDLDSSDWLTEGDFEREELYG